MMRNYTMVVLAMLALVALPSESVAGGSSKGKKAEITVPGTRVGVIDIQAILRDSKAAQSLREQVDKETRKYRDQWVKRRDKIKDMQQDLERQRGLLSQDAFDKKYREWEKEATAFNREVKGREDELTLASNEALALLNEDLLKIIQQLKLKSNVNLVVGRSQVLIMDDQMDLTPHALKALDKARPKINLDIAKASEKLKEVREKQQQQNN
ncbi:MAG: OmpH family outer membrane protein [Alphaproteobacteria bacterium GM202ARS2]|nr:OmpH family outer membrane protein [Alphaproteobacteria bacterium GM202ARS2]